jgi:hypothetical protein
MQESTNCHPDGEQEEICPRGKDFSSDVLGSEKQQMVATARVPRFPTRDKKSANQNSHH